jgi:hypothetical protein
MAVVAEIYRVMTRWDGRQWMVRVEDGDGFHRAETTARRLEQVEGRARARLERERHRGVAHQEACDCTEPVEMVVEVQLHPDVELGLQTAEDLVDDATTELERAVAALGRAGMSAQDIMVLLTSRPLTARPRRALVVPNTEVAAVALDCRPDAIAVRWEDRGFGVTTYCRDCVEADRSPWRELPHATSALVYDGPVRCDGCDRDVTASGNVHQMAMDGV